MAQAEPKTKATVNVMAKARDAMDGCNNYREGAAVLLSWAERDQALWNAIMEPFAMNACISAIQKAMATYRTRIVENIKHEAAKGLTAADEASRAKALLSVNYMSVMDFPLPGGRRLGDATMADLEEAIAFTSRLRSAYTVQEKWYRKVYEMMARDPTKRVSEVLTEDAVRAARLSSETANDPGAMQRQSPT